MLFFFPYEVQFLRTHTGIKCRHKTNPKKVSQRSTTCAQFTGCTLQKKKKKTEPFGLNFEEKNTLIKIFFMGTVLNNLTRMTVS